MKGGNQMNVTRTGARKAGAFARGVVDYARQKPYGPLPLPEGATPATPPLELTPPEGAIPQKLPPPEPVQGKLDLQKPTPAQPEFNLTPPEGEVPKPDRQESFDFAPERAAKLEEKLPPPSQPITAYHGTDADAFTEFDPAKRGTATDQGQLGAGHYFSTDENVARGKKTTIEAQLDLKKPLRIEFQKGMNKDEMVNSAIGTQGLKGQALTDALKQRGYDGVVLDYSPMGYKHSEIMVIDPERIKVNKTGQGAEPEIDIGTNRKNLNRHLNATPEIKEKSRALAQEMFKKSRGDLSSQELTQIWEKINEGKRWDPRHPDRNKSLEERAAARQAQGTTAESNPEGGLLNQLQQSLDKVADEAKQRIDQRGTFKGNKLNMNLPVDDLGDMAIWGAAKIARGAVTFAKWSKEMVSEFGDSVKPHLEKLWTKAQEWHDKNLEKMGGNLTSTKELLKLYREGKAGQDWYKYTRAELEQYFGKDAELFTDFLAATSPNATVASNVTQALKAYQQFKMNQPFRGFMPAVIGNLEKLAKGQPPVGPKVSSFKANLFGDPMPVTVDRWMMRAAGWPGKMMTPQQYKFFDAYFTQIALKAGVEPRQLQAGIWRAIKEAEQKVGNTSESFEEVLKRNMEQKPELRKVIEELRKGKPQPSR
jgi:hypothetical protein